MATLVYAMLGELKQYMNEITDTADDATLSTCLTGASRAIDSYTGRRYWIDDAPTARVVRTLRRVTHELDGELLHTADIADDTGITVESFNGSDYSPIESSQYDLVPESSLDLGRPITGLLASGMAWSTCRKVRITATWGWPAVPGEVHQACLIQASRLYSRKDSPTGVMGSSEWGLMRLPHMDPDVKSLLRQLCVPGFG